MNEMNEKTLFAALNYSKMELQQAENKTNIMVTMNSLLMAAWGSCGGILATSQHWDWKFCWLFILYPFLILTSLTILAIAYKVRIFNDQGKKSIWNFNNTLSEISNTQIENAIDEIKKTISINSNLIKKKYKCVNCSLFITFFPFSIIYIILTILKKKKKT